MTNSPQNPFQKSAMARCKSAIEEANSVSAQTHNGLKGQFREIVAAKILTPILPPEIRIGTGQLVSVNGNLSPQIDLVLHAPAVLPAFLYDEKSGYFPVESCLYAIEVKSRLTSSDLKTAIASAQATRALPLVNTEHWVSNPGDKNLVKATSTGTPKAIHALFAFGSDLSGDAKSELTRYRGLDDNADTDPAIDVICVVGRGYWYSTRPGWKFVEADENVEEVMSFLAGTANTLPQLIVAKGRPRFGMYLTTPNGDPKSVVD
jgi:hypothetical protein